MLNKASTSIPDPTPKALEIEAQFDTIQKSVEILCWLGEEVEKNVAAMKRGSFIPAGCTMLDDLAGEQAYVIKKMLADLRGAWTRFADEVAA